MTDDNPLVAGPRSEPDTLEGDVDYWMKGTGIYESAYDLGKGIAKGDWIEITIGGVGTGLEALGAFMDPIGALLLEPALGFIIEHVEPLQQALDDLAGDPEVIQGFGETWGNVAEQVAMAADMLRACVEADLTQWEGEAAEAYVKAVGERYDAIKGTGVLAEVIGIVVVVVGELVAAVRELVRDVVAALVAWLIEAILEEIFSIGFATPYVVEQAIGTVARAAGKIAKFIKALLRTLSELGELLPKAMKLLVEAIEALTKRGSRGTSTSTVDDIDPPSSDPPDPAGGPDADPPSDDPAPGADGPGKDGPGEDGPASDGPTPKPDGHGQDGPTQDGPKPDPDGSGTDGPTKDGPSPDPDGTDPDGPAHDGPSPDPDGTDPDGTDPDGTDSDGPADSPIGDDADKPGDTSTPHGEKDTVGDPIDVVTGEMILAHTDVALPGVLPLVLRRVHVSSYRSGVSFGRSWASTVDQRVEVAADRVYFASEDGLLLRYPSPAPGAETLPDKGPRLAMTVSGDEHVVTDPERGRSLHFAGTDGGRIKPLRAITDRNGNRIDFLRDDRGVLTEITHSGGYRVEVRSVRGWITELRLHEAGTLMSFRYDEAGRLSGVVNSSGVPLRLAYDEDRITGWEDRNGRWNRYDYDEDGRCVHTGGSAGFLDYRLSFDPENRVTTATNSVGDTTRFHFDATGKVTRQVDALGNTTLSEWDSQGRLLARTDPVGRTSRRRYDDNGDVREIVRPDGSTVTIDYADGHPVAVTDPTGSVWRQEFDGHGNRIATIDPTGAATTFQYTASGALESVADPLGHRMTIECDALGLPVTVTEFGGATTRYQRDAFGRVVSITDDLGAVTTFSWTTEGKLASRVGPDGATERWRYDGQGNQAEHIDELGTVTRTAFTPFDLPASATDQDGARLEYGYDTELRLTTVTNAAGLVWRYEHDAVGNVVRETDFNGQVTGYAYDGAGQLVERVDGAGERTRYERDVLGRVVEVHRADGVTTFRYDPMGRLLAAANPDAELSYQWDAAGRVVAETCNGRTVTSTYDARGRRVHRRTPSGVDSSWEYGATGRPMALHTAGQTLRFDYDIAGREVRRTIGVATLAQQWDVTNRLKVQHLTVAGANTRGAAVVQRRSYGYRADGYVHTVVDQLTGTRRFDLDRNGRVEAAYDDYFVERYAYDAAGNLANVELPGHVSDGGREYHGTLLRRSGSNRYRHDPQGRLVHRQQATAGAPLVWRYRWNCDDRLAAITTPDGQWWQYRYDPLGRRIAKLRLRPDGAAGERIDFVWDGPVLVEQTTAAATTTWDWQPSGFRPLTQTERATSASGEDTDAAFYAIVTDIVGTPTELVDPHGNVSTTGRTTLWGEPLRPGQGARTPLRFPGQYFDAESGLHYNLNRYYDPANARFASLDPLGLGPAPNPHAYVHNPLNWFDPLGLNPNDGGPDGDTSTDGDAGFEPSPGDWKGHWHQANEHYDDRFQILDAASSFASAISQQKGGPPLEGWLSYAGALVSTAYRFFRH